MPKHHKAKHMDKHDKYYLDVKTNEDIKLNEGTKNNGDTKNNEDTNEKSGIFNFDETLPPITINLTINIYTTNNNENNNNLANQGGQAGVTLTAIHGGQISGDKSKNIIQEKESETEQILNQDGETLNGEINIDIEEEKSNI